MVLVGTLGWHTYQQILLAAVLSLLSKSPAWDKSGSPGMPTADQLLNLAPLLEAGGDG